MPDVRAVDVFPVNVVGRVPHYFSDACASSL